MDVPYLVIVFHINIQYLHDYDVAGYAPQKHFVGPSCWNILSWLKVA